jgi:hypothetical protein
MSNATDIAAHTATVNGRFLRIHATVAEPSRKVDAAQRRHCSAAANRRIMGLIRELLAIVDVAVSTATIERFHAEMTDSSTSSRQHQRFNRRGDCVQKAIRRRTTSVSTNLAP